MINDRPHPGPLPQEREEHSQRSWNPIPLGLRTVFERRPYRAPIATGAFEPSSDARNISLSLGERAGVRASVLQINPRT